MDRMFVSLERRMHCGMGKCCRCNVGSTYTCTDGQGTLDTSFSGLVPDGLYTMWYAFASATPQSPPQLIELPLGAADGSTSSFRADAEGNAAFVQSFAPCLQMSDTWTTAMLAINYHSDGKTYGGDPGPFGLGAHVPLFVMLPKRAGIQ